MNWTRWPRQRPLRQGVRCEELPHRKKVNKQNRENARSSSISEDQPHVWEDSFISDHFYLRKRVVCLGLDGDSTPFCF